MSFQITADLTVTAVSEALHSSNLHPSHISGLVPSSVAFEGLRTFLGISARSSKTIAQLRRFLLSNAEKITEEFNQRFSPTPEHESLSGSAVIHPSSERGNQEDSNQRFPTAQQHQVICNSAAGNSDGECNVMADVNVAEFDIQSLHSTKDCEVEIELTLDDANSPLSEEESGENESSSLSFSEGGIFIPESPGTADVNAEKVGARGFTPTNDSEIEVVELTLDDANSPHSEEERGDNESSSLSLSGGEIFFPESPGTADVITEKISVQGFTSTKDRGAEIIQLTIDDVYSDPAELKAAKKRHCEWPKGTGSIIGSFSVTPDDWLKVWSWEQNKMLPGRGYSSLIDRYIEKNNISNCHFYAKQPNINKGNIVFYCYCGYVGCATFKVVSKSFPRQGHSIEFTVEKFGKELHQNRKPITRQITGLDRKELKEKLKSKTAFELRDEYVNALPSEKVERGNVGQVKRLATLRKVHSEALTEEDRHPDFMINEVLDWGESMKRYVPDDVEILDNDKVPGEHLFVQRVGLPFFKFMHSIEELQLFLTAIADALAKGQGPTLNLDATSQLNKPYKIPGVKPLKCFLYAIVFAIRNRLMSLSTAILSQHDAHHIEQWLIELRFFLEMHHQWPIKNNLIVIDGSFPLLYAVLKAFNTMTLLQYLVLCHIFATSKEEDRHSVFSALITIIKFCCAHKMKNFVENLSTHARRVSVTDRQFLLRCIGTFFMCKEYELLKVMFQNLFLILMSKSVSKETEESVQFFNRLIGEPESSLQEEKICNLQTSVEAVEASQKFSSKSLYAQSPFYKDLKIIYDEASKCAAGAKEVSNPDDPDDPPVAISTSSSKTLNQTEDGASQQADNAAVSNSGDSLSLLATSKSFAPLPSSVSKQTPSVTNRITNRYYSPAFAKHLLIYQCPMLPLWTAIVYRPAFQGDPVRWSNANAEGYMKNTKVDVCKKVRNWRPNRFSRRQRNHVRSVWKDNRLNMQNVGAQNFPRKPTAGKAVFKRVRKPRVPRKVIKKIYRKAKPITINEGLETQENKEKDQTAHDYPSMLAEEQWRKVGDKLNLLPKYIPEELISFNLLSSVNTASSSSKAQSLSVVPVPITTQNQTDTTSDHTPPLEEPMFEEILQFETYCTGSCDLMENGLISDPKFYCSLSKVFLSYDVDQLFNYFIASYKFHPLGGVFLQDFETLRPNKWLNGFILDALAELFVSRCKNYNYIHTLHSSNILNGKISTLIERNVKFAASGTIQQDFLVMFYQQRASHWLLVICHIPAKIVYFLDPMTNYGANEEKLYQKLMKNFVSFLVKRCPSLARRGWKVSSISHPTQNDNSNCGIYCLFFLIFILKSRTIPQSIPNSMMCINGSDEVFNANVLRLIFQKCLLFNSEKVQLLCASCGKASNGDVKFCSGKCLRFCHNSVFCLNYFFSMRNTTCRLCEHYSTLFSNSVNHMPPNISTPLQSVEESESRPQLSVVGSTVLEPSAHEHSPREEVQVSPVEEKPLESSAHDDSEDEEKKSLSREAYEKLIDLRERYNPDTLFLFEDFMEPASEPEHLNEIPRIFAERFTHYEGSTVPLYVARNPFPAALDRNDTLPPNFFSLANGNVNKLNYHVPVWSLSGQQQAYLVCSFLFPNLFYQDVFDYDFRTLDFGEPLAEVVMDVVTCLFIKLLNGKDITYIPCAISKTFIERGEGSLYDLREKQFSDDCRYVMTVRHENFHYTLIIIDRYERTLLHMDPCGGNDEIVFGQQLAKMFSTLPNLQLSEASNLQNQKNPLRFIQRRHPLQSKEDAVNCGVFCLYFVDKYFSRFAEQESFDYSNDGVGRKREEKHWSEREFCIASYRQMLKLMLLWHSEDLSQMCVTCSIQDVAADIFVKMNTYHYIRCMDCDRVVHQKKFCIALSSFKDASSFEPKEFYCLLCRAHRKTGGLNFNEKVRMDRGDLQKMARAKSAENEKNRNLNNFLTDLTSGLL